MLELLTAAMQWRFSLGLLELKDFQRWVNHKLYVLIPPKWKRRIPNIDFEPFSKKGYVSLSDRYCEHRHLPHQMERSVVSSRYLRHMEIRTLSWIFLYFYLLVLTSWSTRRNLCKLLKWVHWWLATLESNCGFLVKALVVSSNWAFPIYKC